MLDFSKEEIREWETKTNALHKTVRGILDGTIDPVSFIQTYTVSYYFKKYF